MSEKQKLTLSVNKEVVEKAKEMGINISEITENVLRGFAFTPTELDDAELYSQYKELFSIMLPTMKKYDFSVPIASDPVFDKKTDEHIWAFTIHLTTSSLFWVDEIEQSFSDISAIPISSFYPPRKILSSFIEKLTKSVDKRKEHLKELEMAKQIIQVITGSVLSGNRGTHDRSDR